MKTLYHYQDDAGSVSCVELEARDYGFENGPFAVLTRDGVEPMMRIQHETTHAAAHSRFDKQVRTRLNMLLCNLSVGAEIGMTRQPRITDGRGAVQ